jgi:hypothetical protein
MYFLTRRALFNLFITTQLVATVGTAASQQCCGDWQEIYKKTHEDILNGITAPRFAVALTPASGFSGSYDVQRPLKQQKLTLTMRYLLRFPRRRASRGHNNFLLRTLDQQIFSGE